MEGLGSGWSEELGVGEWGRSKGGTCEWRGVGIMENGISGSRRDCLCVGRGRFTVIRLRENNYRWFPVAYCWFRVPLLLRLIGIGEGVGSIRAAVDK